MHTGLNVKKKKKKKHATRITTCLVRGTKAPGLLTKSEAWFDDNNFTLTLAALVECDA